MDNPGAALKPAPALPDAATGSLSPAPALFQAAAAALLAVVLLLPPSVLPTSAAPVVAAFRAAGIGGLALGALLLALTGEAAALAMARARRVPPMPRGWRWWRRLALDGAGDAARRGQGVIVPALAGLTLLVAWAFRPSGEAVTMKAALLLAAAMLTLAFPCLVAERAMASDRRLPEAPDLRALRLVPVLALMLAAACGLALASGWRWAAGAALVGQVAIGAIAAELALRALGRWFLPEPAVPRAACRSLLAALLAGSIAGGGIAAPLREQLGIDVGRSWALRFLRRAVPVAVALSAALAWGLTGVVMIAPDARGIYERFGAPAAVWHPGLHLGLPWPLGRVRLLPYGPVSELALAGRVDSAEALPAEAPPPAAFDRLWEGTHPGETVYLIAGAQSVQVVSADIRILWRVGLSDEAAIAAAYATDDPEGVMRAAARRLLSRDFAGRSLPELMGGQRESMAEALRSSLSTSVARLAPGIDIVAVVIEAVHPPSGAARAYHAVAAAAINAQAAVADERAWAAGTLGTARQQAERRTLEATSKAAETLGAARVEATKFNADRLARDAGGSAFLLERYFDSLARAFTRHAVTLVDHRLDAAQVPAIDLRPFAGATETGAEDRATEEKGGNVP